MKIEIVAIISVLVLVVVANIIYLNFPTWKDKIKYWQNKKKKVGRKTGDPKELKTVYVNYDSKYYAELIYDVVPKLLKIQKVKIQYEKLEKTSFRKITKIEAASHEGADAGCERVLLGYKIQKTTKTIISVYFDFERIRIKYIPEYEKYVLELKEKISNLKLKGEKDERERKVKQQTTRS